VPSRLIYILLLHPIPPPYKRSYAGLQRGGCEPEDNSGGHHTYTSGHHLCNGLVGNIELRKTAGGVSIASVLLPIWE